MKEINESDITGPLNGIYVFVVNDCRVCRDYLRELERRKLDTDNWNLFDCDKNLAYSMNNLHLEDMPMTRFYLAGKVIWERAGILYDTQLMDLFKATDGYEF